MLLVLLLQNLLLLLLQLLLSYENPPKGCLNKNRGQHTKSQKNVKQQIHAMGYAGDL